MSAKKDGEKKKKSKKKILLPVVVLLVAGVGYKMFLAPKPVPPKPKIAGEVMALEREFIINLEEGHYGKVSVALILEHDPKGGAGHAADEGIPQEPVIRAIVTDTLTGLAPDELTDHLKREELLKEIAKEIAKTTDVHVEEVLFTDLAVQ